MVVGITPRACCYKTLLVVALLALGGCGESDADAGSDAINAAPSSDDGSGGSSSGGSGSGSENTSDPDISNRITGSIGDGPIVGARLRAYTQSGQVLRDLTISSADYDFTIKTKGNNYPLSIWADEGTDLVTGLAPDFTMLAIVRNPSTRTVSNLNPFSTLIFQTASRSGSITENSVDAARQTVLSRYSFGLDENAFGDPLSTVVNDNNIHLIVKASEALGEVIRRTRDAMIAAGNVVNGNEVLNAIAADLTDGWLDGVGATGSDPRLAAVANVASAAVLLETLSNQLQVNGTDAGTAMDMAILQVRPGAPATSLTANVPVTTAALDQAIRTLWSAHVVQPDQGILDAITALESVAAGTLPGTVANLLPAGVHATLRQATTDSAYASDFTLDTINAQASDSANPPVPVPVPPQPEPEPEPQPEPEPEPQPEPEPEPEPEPQPEPEPEPPVNNPPTISGTPNTALLEGAPWSFTPAANDPDGDNLNFLILGAPSWANVDSATGQIYGTPGSGDAGVYPNVRILVSDGELSAELPAFTLTVTAPQPVTGSATLTWLPPTMHTDGTPLIAINGYRIYYGRDANNLEQVITVSGGITSYLIDNLEVGTWYFAIAAIDSNNVEGGRTDIVSKTVR